MFGISEYCGLVSCWIVPVGSDNCSYGFGVRWIEQVAETFRTIVKDTFGETLRRIGTASNGESFFERAS